MGSHFNLTEEALAVLEETPFPHDELYEGECVVIANRYAKGRGLGYGLAWFFTPEHVARVGLALASQPGLKAVEVNGQLLTWREFLLEVLGEKYHHEYDCVGRLA